MTIKGTQSIHIMQTAQDRLKTKMQVETFNTKIEEGKFSNKVSQKDEFLRILVTQLKNQNPLEPIKDKEFIAQMAQLSSVEKLEQLNDHIGKIGDIASNNTLFGLVGKTVSYINHEGREVTGVVDSIHLKEGRGFISVDHQEINLEDLTKIQQTEETHQAITNNNISFGG